ncbi:hypothetical protein [Streptomyces sp. NPDC001601]|uniref:hypothetical protein n=1 Tax=unclassified Streptomyces TaxID=2593676 RepID=UPI0036B0A054
MIARLTAERELGCLAGDTDIDTAAPTLVGTLHLLFAGRASAPPQNVAIHKMVTTVIVGSLRPLPRRDASAQVERRHPAESDQDRRRSLTHLGLRE